METLRFQLIFHFSLPQPLYNRCQTILQCLHSSKNPSQYLLHTKHLFLQCPFHLLSYIRTMIWTYSSLMTFPPKATSIPLSMIIVIPPSTLTHLDLAHLHNFLSSNVQSEVSSAVASDLDLPPLSS